MPRSSFGFVSLSTAVMVGGMAISCLSVGCGGGKKPLPPAQNQGGSNSAGSKECNDLVQLALSSMQPEQFASGDVSGALTILDSWNADCQTSGTQSIAAAMVGEATRRVLDEAQLARVEADQFDEHDATHVRNAILFHATAEAVAKATEGQPDVERVNHVFDFVVQQVQLVDDEHPLAGLGAFEALVFGEGSARDRAWVVAELLRQLRFDAVILEPATADAAAGKEPSPFLLGVLVGDDCLLYDPRMGIPIPGPGDTGKTWAPAPPATLADVRAEGDLLAALDLPDDPYPLDDASLDDVRVHVIANSSLFAPRLAGLHALLTGTTVVDSFDADEESLGYQPVGVRLEGQGWKAENVAVWTYPDACIDASLEDAAADRRSAVLARRETFTTPLAGSGGTLLRARLDQLRGSLASTDDVDGAVAKYTRIRDTDQHASTVHEDAARDAVFWTALSTLATGDRLTGESQLRGYLTRYPNGRFVPACHQVLARGRARRGSYARAIEDLEAVPAEAADRRGVQVLLRRWKAIAAES